jgi:hypothetical protein
VAAATARVSQCVVNPATKDEGCLVSSRADGLTGWREAVKRKARVPPPMAPALNHCAERCLSTWMPLIDGRGLQRARGSKSAAKPSSRRMERSATLGLARASWLSSARGNPRSITPSSVKLNSGEMGGDWQLPGRPTLVAGASGTCPSSKLGHVRRHFPGRRGAVPALCARVGDTAAAPRRESWSLVLPFIPALSGRSGPAIRRAAPNRRRSKLCLACSA